MTVRHVDLTCPDCAAHHTLKLDLERMQRVRVRGKCSNCATVFDVAERLVAAMKAKEDTAGVEEIQEAERVRRDSVWSANPNDVPAAQDDPSGSFSEPPLGEEEIILLDEAEEVVLLVESAPPAGTASQKPTSRPVKSRSKRKSAPAKSDQAEPDKRVPLATSEPSAAHDAVTVAPSRGSQRSYDMPTVIPQRLPADVTKELGIRQADARSSIRADEAMEAWRISSSAPPPEDAKAAEVAPIKRLPVPVISDRPLRPLEPLVEPLPTLDDDAPRLEGHVVPEDFAELDDLFDGPDDDEPTNVLVTKYVATVGDEATAEEATAEEATAEEAADETPQDDATRTTRAAGRGANAKDAVSLSDAPTQFPPQLKRMPESPVAHLADTGSFREVLPSDVSDDEVDELDSEPPTTSDVVARMSSLPQELSPYALKRQAEREAAEEAAATTEDADAGLIDEAEDTPTGKTLSPVPAAMDADMTSATTQFPASADDDDDDDDDDGELYGENEVTETYFSLVARPIRRSPSEGELPIPDFDALSEVPLDEAEPLSGSSSALSPALSESRALISDPEVIAQPVPSAPPSEAPPGPPSHPSVDSAAYDAAFAELSAPTVPPGTPAVSDEDDGRVKVGDPRVEPPPPAGRIISERGTVQRWLQRAAMPLAELPAHRDQVASALEQLLDG